MKSKTEQSNSIKNPFSIRDKIGYLFGDFGNDFTFLLASGYLFIFYTKVLGIGAGVVGTMFVVARFVDAFTDVGMGHICDSSKMTKNGRFRPWIKRMSLPVVLASLLMYNPFIVDWSYNAKITYMFITYILWGSVFYTSINIPYGSMASVITQDVSERASLSIFRTLGAISAGLLIGVFTPLMIYVEGDNGIAVSGERFFFIALIFGILAFIAYGICFKMTTERVEIKITSKTKQNNIISDLKFLIKDRAFIIVISSALLTLIAVLSGATLNQYLFLDYFGNTKLLPFVSLTMTIGMLSIAPFASRISKEVGKKEASAVALLITGVIYLLIYVLQIKNPLIYIGLITLGFVGMGYYSMVSWAYLTDVIDNYQLKTGKRKDGTVYAVYSFARKVGQGLAAGIGGWTLAIIGYDEIALTQSKSVQNGIFTVAMLVPAVCYIATALLLFFVYPLSKKKVAENQKKIEHLMKVIEE